MTDPSIVALRVSAGTEAFQAAVRPTSLEVGYIGTSLRRAYRFFFA
jgi:hypothetical protein